MKHREGVGNVTKPDGRYCDFQFSGIHIIRTGGPIAYARRAAIFHRARGSVEGRKHLETTLYVLREYLYRPDERRAARPILFPSKVGLATKVDPIEYSRIESPWDHRFSRCHPDAAPFSPFSALAMYLFVTTLETIVLRCCVDGI